MEKWKSNICHQIRLYTRRLKYPLALLSFFSLYKLSFLSDPSLSLSFFSLLRFLSYLSDHILFFPLCLSGSSLSHTHHRPNSTSFSLLINLTALWDSEYQLCAHTPKQWWIFKPFAACAVTLVSPTSFSAATNAAIASNTRML